MFGDSAQDVFSAVAFLRGKVATTTGYTTALAFVFVNARVALMIALTIPKLELQALLLAARLRKEIENALTVRVDNTFVDGQCDGHSVAPFIGETAGVCHQPPCRNPGTSDSG